MSDKVNTIKNCFNIILQENKKESHSASRKVRKILYSSPAGNREIFKEIAEIIEKAPINYESKYKKYKYIDSIPASPYKSVQMILADLEESCCE